MEAEYIALSEASMEAKYIQNILKELWPSTKKFIIFTDSEAARKVATGTGQVRKVKHLETRYLKCDNVFAGEGNAVCKRFCLRWGCKGSEGINGLVREWGERNWVVPPLSLLRVAVG